MIWSGQELGDERFVGRLLHMWEQQPALRYGATYYNAVPCDSPQVFTVLRTWENDRLLGLLNVGPHRQTITISLPVDTLGLPDADYTLYELLGARAWVEDGQRSWRRDELLSLRITLEPFGAYCFALRPVAHAELPVADDALGIAEPSPHAEEPPLSNGVETLAQTVAHGRQTAEDTPKARRSRRRREVAD
jgi:hypothetical protein